LASCGTLMSSLKGDWHYFCVLFQSNAPFFKR
jgi:hypothetical protein